MTICPIFNIVLDTFQLKVCPLPAENTFIGTRSSKTSNFRNSVYRRQTSINPSNLPSAEGNYEITGQTKVKVFSSGKIQWEPPEIYRYFCNMIMTYYPYDEQLCFMKIGAWSHDGTFINVDHVDKPENVTTVKPSADVTSYVDYRIELGTDLRDFTKSGAWDVIAIPAEKNIVIYPSDITTPYPDVTFYFRLRRKGLFYTVTLIMPCVSFGLITILLYYLPTDSCEKVTLSVSVLLALIFFFLLLLELIPPTSTAVPLIGKYLLAILGMVCFSISQSICLMNVQVRETETLIFTINAFLFQFAAPLTNAEVPPWIRRVFINKIPAILHMRRRESLDDSKSSSSSSSSDIAPTSKLFTYTGQREQKTWDTPWQLDPIRESSSESTHRFVPPAPSGYAPRSRISGARQRILLKIVENVKFIAEKIKSDNEEAEYEQDWKFIAIVADRLCLIVFGVLGTVLTFSIILNAPSLYDNSPSLPRDCTGLLFNITNTDDIPYDCQRTRSLL